MFSRMFMCLCAPVHVGVCVHVCGELMSLLGEFPRQSLDEFFEKKFLIEPRVTDSSG